MPSRSPEGTPAKRSSSPPRGQAALPAEAAAKSGLFARVNRELYKRNAELAVRNKTLGLLQKLDELAMSTLGMTDMAEEISATIASELSFEFVSVAVVDAEDKVLRWLGMSSPVPAFAAVLKGFPARALVLPLQETAVPAIRALRRTGPLMLPGVRGVVAEPLAKALMGSIRAGAPRLCGSLVLPLRLGRRAIGVLTVSAARDLADLSRYEREALAGITGLVAVALEKARITRDLQETTADLRVANAQLGELDKAKSEFLSIASHQLYTPLTALKGYLSMLQEGDFGIVAEKQRGVIDILRQSSDRLIDLIKNLLDISRIESGRLEISLEAADLVALARDLVTELKPNAEKKGLALEFREPTAPLPRVVADVQRLRQVLLNVVDNAVKYTEAGRIDVRVQRSGDSLVFYVVDTGKGITPVDLRRIFAKFVRVGNANRHLTEGTGLGLYVARQLIREIHGDIWAESAGEGRGSTFFVRLPVEGSPQALRAGTKLTVGIKAGEAGQRPDDLSPEASLRPSEASRGGGA